MVGRGGAAARRPVSGARVCGSGGRRRAGGAAGRSAPLERGGVGEVVGRDLGDAIVVDLDDRQVLALADHGHLLQVVVVHAELLKGSAGRQRAQPHKPVVVEAEDLERREGRESGVRDHHHLVRRQVELLERAQRAQLLPRQLCEAALDVVEEVESLQLLELADARVDGLDAVLVEQQLLQVDGGRDLRPDCCDGVVRSLDLDGVRRDWRQRCSPVAHAR